LLENEIKKLNYFQEIDRKNLILNPDECLKFEPTLEKIYQQKKLAGGIFFEDDARGDPYKFTTKLQKICEKKFGVVFNFNCEIKNILTNFKKITGINTSKEVYTADAYVSCLGSSSNHLFSGIGLTTKIYPIKGYSLSIECNRTHEGPTLTMTDNENKIVYARNNNIFRVAGTIEIAKKDSAPNNKNLKFLYQNAQKTFSNYGDLKNATEWSGYRPFRPNSLPLIGKFPNLENLFINSGGASLGWTNSLASGHLLEQIISQKISKNFDFLKEEFV
jgi:D-amino-acid dehydrogenase